MKTTSRYPAVAKRRQPEQFGSGSAVLIVGSLLFAAAVFFQSPARSTPLDVGTVAEAAAAVAATKGHGTASQIAELEKQFWVCDYIGTTRGIEGPHWEVCSANYEELKQTKFGGDFEKLVTWWRLNKVAQHQALESAGSAQY
jgi:hypothetical protein